MATAKKLPSGNWRVQIFSHKDGNGKRHYESFTAPSKREAELKAVQFASTKNRISLSDYTVMEAVKGYIALKENVLSPSTIRGYLANLKHFNTIASIRLTRLDNKTVQSFINSLTADLSPKSVRNVYALFTSALSLYAPEIYFKGITLPQKPKRLKKAPSDAIVEKIYESSAGELKKAIYLAFFGIRRGEICALEYSDIEENLVHIHRDIIRGRNGWIVKDIPKTSESERYVLLPDDYRDTLGEGDGKIISLSPGTITHKFHSLAASFGVDLHLHDLRKYFASMAHIMGIPDQIIMAMGGWKSDHVMKSVYRNSIDDVEKKYREEYAKKISKL